MTTINEASGRDYHNEIRAERDALRAERDEAITENLGLKVWRDKLMWDRDAAIARAESAEHELKGVSDQCNKLVDRLQQTERERDRFRSEIDRLEYTCERISESAERKLAMAAEALKEISYPISGQAAAIFARNTLHKMEKADDAS